MQKIAVKSVRDADVAGKRVLLRAGLNVPIAENGEVKDVFRLRKALPTIEYLSRSGAKTIIISHLGRDGSSLKPVVEALQKCAPSIPVSFFGGGISGILPEVKDGHCLVLENIRREPGEETNDPELAQKLASLADCFVNDAFADSHRAHASIVGVAQLLPSYAGLLMEEEIIRLSEALTPPPGAIAIIGGAKFETKQPLIEKLLPLYEKVCVGGALANDFYKAQGVSVGTSLVSSMPIPKEILENTRVLIQPDVLVQKGDEIRASSYHEIQSDEQIVDAGPETVDRWGKEIATAPFVLWNGPLGIYERGCVRATDAIAKAISISNARAAVGGGDTIAALANFSFDEKRVFLSTGGGAMLQFLAEGTLVGIEALGVK